jgi:peptidoglycan hydrolase-like protein with peptidoglycan-binding domain
VPPRKPRSDDRRIEEPSLDDGEEGGHWAQRKAWMERRRGLYADGPRILARASAARAEEELMAAKAPPGAPGSRNWTPIGPSAVGYGQASGEPVVSGRVLGIEVGPGSTHAYAGVADGGIWRWRRDTALNPPFEHWEPQDDFVLAPTAPAAAANSLSVGDIAVAFDPGGDPDLDTIFVGTGEGHVNRIMGTVGGSYFGVGVRISLPAAPPNARAWTIETYATPAPVQPATFRLVLDTDVPTRPWAATSGGLYRRTAAAGTPWAQIGTGGANALPGGMVTDVRVTGTTATATKAIYAAVANVGVFQSTDDGANWAQLPGLPGPNAPGRISLALDESVAHTDVVYALCEHASGSGVNRQLFRFRLADGRFREVRQMPGVGVLTGTQGDYDLAIAVAPGNVNRVFVAGAVVLSDATSQGEWELAAYRGTIANPSANVFTFGFAGANNDEARAHRDATFVGRGVHGDGHCFAFGRDVAGTELATDVWIGCDGGVFRSTASGDNGTFTALNTGLATIQLTYLDNHPVHESVVVAGCQDNGVVRTLGDATWLENPKSDGGGVAIDQTFPWRMIGQTFNDSFFVSANAGREWRGVQIGAPEGVAFYTQLCSAPAAGGPPPPVATPNPGWCLAGATRVWATFDWGTTWVTLPAATTPPPGNVAQDLLDGSLVVSLVWPVPNRVYAATQLGVFRIDYNPVAAAWAAPVNLGAPPGLALGATEITDIAVADPATDDLYVSLGGVGEHVFWFDQAAAAWRNTASLTRFDAPVQAIEADLASPNDVWVGTDVGMYHATHVRPAVGVPRSWTWTPAPGPSQGMPEAAVTDLQIQASTRMLRAATHGRGAWELPVSVNVGRDPDLFLRMNPADNGRRHAAARNTADPTRIRRDNATPITVDWGDSPDLKIRRGIAAQAPHAFPGNLRLQSPRMTGQGVRRWQRYAARRGIDLGVHGADGTFGPATDAAVRELQRRLGLLVWSNGNVTDGVVGRRTWAATAGYPALAARLDHRAFTMDVQDDHVEASGLLLADATGTNRVFLQLHNRGSRDVPAARVRALLLLAAQTGAGAAPDLPAGWDARLANADVTAWTGAWTFADPPAPYRSPVVPLGSREPQVVEWQVDFAARGFNPGDTVVMLAFLTTTAPGAPNEPADVLTNAEVRVRQLVEGERRVAARRVRLDAVSAVP